VVGERQGWQNRWHFFGAAAEAMRRILVDRARSKRAARHGGTLQRPALTMLLAIAAILTVLPAANPQPKVEVADAPEPLQLQAGSQELAVIDLNLAVEEYQRTRRQLYTTKLSLTQLAIRAEQSGENDGLNRQSPRPPTGRP
jgi:ECF sigma factor